MKNILKQIGEFLLIMIIMSGTGIALMCFIDWIGQSFPGYPVY